MKNLRKQRLEKLLDKEVQVFFSRDNANHEEKDLITRFVGMCEDIINPPIGQPVTIRQILVLPESCFFIKGSKRPSKSFEYAKKYLARRGLRFKDG